MSDRTKAELEVITIDQEAAQAIREALIIGLRCYGEVARLNGFAEVFKASGGYYRQRRYRLTQKPVQHPACSPMPLLT